MQDIADRCGVSKVTVSRAFRGERRFVSRETVDRVLSVARELGYDPSYHQAARRLALRKVGKDVLNMVIAFCFPADLYLYNYFGLLFKGMMDAAIAQGYSLLSVVDLRLKQPPIPAVFARGDVDGIISLMHANDFTKALEHLRSELSFQDRPAVSLMEPAKGCSSVLADEFEGGYSSAAHLLDLGHRHMLHFIVRTGIWPHAERLRGYRQAFTDRNLDPDGHLASAEWYTETQPWPGLPGPERIVLPALREHPEITAILARNDVMATKIKHSLSRAGIRVPENISLVGYDDTDPIVDDRGDNVLTTVSVSLGDVGRAAAQLLIGRIEGEESEDRTIVLPTELMVRRSTGPPR